MDTTLLNTLPPPAPAAAGAAARGGEPPGDAPGTDFASLLAQELAPAAAAGAPGLLPAAVGETPAVDAGEGTPADAAAELAALLLPDTGMALPQAALAALAVPPATPVTPAAVEDPLPAASRGAVLSATLAGSPLSAAQSGTPHPATPPAAGGDPLPEAAIPGGPATAKIAAADFRTAAAASERAGPAAGDAQAAMPATPVPAPSLPAPWVVAAAAAAPGAAAAAVTARVDVPLAQPGWSDAFAQRVVWMADRQQPAAELHLNPPELGPVSISLSLDQDRTNVFFSSPHLAVREAIMQALPALREALDLAGLQLGQSGVSAEAFSRQQEPSRDGGRNAAGTDRRDLPPAAVGAARSTRLGLVDTFA